MKSIRTTLLLPADLHQDLLILADQESKNLTEIVRELIAEKVRERRAKQIKTFYQAFKKLQGIGSPGITDASATIDETLYGENGAWNPLRKDDESK